MKVQSTRKVQPLQSNQKIPALQEAQYLKHFPPMIQPYIEKIWDVEANGDCGFQVISWALRSGQDSFMHVQKEILKDLLAQSKFHLNKCLLDKIDKVAERIDVDKSGPCDISHWMSMPTTRHLMAEVYNRP
ncbi:hypothetical protein VP01_2817g1, partial [Puccinia sorghi]